MNHRDTETQRDSLTEEIIGAAIEVHRALGPGLLESAYQECLCAELGLRDLRFVSQLVLPVEYKGLHVDAGYRLDLVVADKVVVELKAVERLLPLHEAQLLTYLRLGGYSTGLLLNFNVPVLKDGIRRMKL
ncbi:MAG: GxxExxY protein [Betaproteobacteria bacterium]|uniref:GxxExxY protein n=1 Tax=Candidatus Proximibacter danicus TaxID=2954365 RepID=A0A9D7K1H4_9PROT|nr:GxxExxY protein [Candidatus Proximibacter danicus]